MRSISQKIVCLILIFIIIFSTNSAFATTEQEQLEAQKQENEKKQNQIEAEKKEVTNEKESTQKEVDNINSQIQDYQTEITNLDIQIANANQQIEDSNSKLEKAQREYESQQQMLEERIVALYEAGDTTYLDILLSSESLTDFISSYYIVSEIAQCDLDLLKEIDKQKNEIETAKKEIEESKQTLTTAKASKQQVSTQLQAKKNEKSTVVAQLSSQEQELQKEIDQLTQDNVQIQQNIAAAQARYKKQLEQLKAQEEAKRKAQEEQAKKNNANKNNGKTNNSSSTNSNSSTSNGGGSSTIKNSNGFIRPVSGGSISTNGYYSSGRFHGAIDYAVSSGSPVYAAADGVVLTVGSLTYSYGTHVIIQHSNGLQTIYGHGTAGSVCVSPGQIVSQGQVIMKSGSTGNSSGPHLHFEVRKSPYNYKYSATKYGDDSRVNPNNYF